MGLTIKLKKYSNLSPIILFFFALFFINTTNSYSNTIKNTELYKKFNEEFNFETDLKIETNFFDHEYEYELIKEFISKNKSKNHDKNLLTYAIASEYLLFSNANYDLEEIDIKYINDLKKIFVNGGFKYQCHTSTSVTNVLLYFGIIIKEDEFKEEVFKCIDYLDQIEYAFLILNMISSRSYISSKNDLFLKDLSLELEYLNFEQSNFNYIHKLMLGSCRADKLFKYKSYSNLIYYYRMIGDTNKVIENYDKAKLVKDICSSKAD